MILFSDKYDAVVTVGSFVPGHLTEDCYEELIRITKQGKGQILPIWNSSLVHL